MKAKNILLTAIIALLAIITSSCEKEQPYIDVLPYKFHFHILDENGNSIFNEENLELAEKNIFIDYENQQFYLNDYTNKSKFFKVTNIPPNTVFSFGAWCSNDFSGSFTINYGDGSSDKISFIMKNYESLDGSHSIKVYLNGEQIESNRYSSDITIVKPADFYENIQ